MGLIVSIFNVLNIPIILKLIIQVICGGIIYLLGAILLKIDVFYFLVNEIKNMFLKRKMRKNEG